MFAWWGRTVYRYRYIVIGVMVALCLGGGIFGISLGNHVTQSGFYDEGSQSVHASVVADEAFGRDRTSHVVAILTPPDGQKVDNPQWQSDVVGELDNFVKDHPDQVVSWVGWLRAPDAANATVQQMKTSDLSKTFVSIPLQGNTDDEILKNYQAVESDLQQLNGGRIELAGLNPLASELTGSIGEDQRRAEVAAIPLVCVVLFFVFGGVVAAALPGLIGGLTIAGALGIMRLLAEFMPVHFFAQPVVTLMGLGIAVDYGLFMVSRFREEIAEGYDTEAAVRRTVMTSGRTIMFSAVILVASSVPLLLFPQGFLKSITYAIIASVMLAAILSVTVLAAALALLGPRVDALGVRTLLRFTKPYPAPSPAETTDRTNPLAIASIPLGVLVPFAAIPVGHIARAQIRRTYDKGANYALLGLVLGYIGSFAWIFVGLFAAKDTLGTGIFYLLLAIAIFVAGTILVLAAASMSPLVRKPTVWWLNWLAEKTQKTKTRAEVEKGFWGKLVNRVMKRPIAFAAPIVIVMILMIIPLGQLSLGGISEKYLPPDNAVRQAQEAFDRSFPGFRTEPLTLVIENDNGEPVTDQQVAEIRSKALTIPGFIQPEDDPTKMWQPRPYQEGGSQDPSVRVIQNGLVNRNDAAKKVEELRDIVPPRGLSISVGGTPALEQDSIHSLFDKLPLMVTILIVTTTILMFLAFGSVVLPIKAAVMSALTLGSTMGVLTWMFVVGHGSGLMNYTPQPLMAPMIGLIIAVIWGLSTDYEVFLVSRMVEARERGLSTAEAIRVGTATTGRLITGAALVLAVVAGAFVFSDLVMMKYLAFGLLIALLLDATIVRMFLVPAVMKLLGDDCWWAPRWMKRIQERMGLGETELPDERKRPAVRETVEDPEALVGAGAPVPPRPRPPHDPTHPVSGSRPGATRAAAPQRVPSASGTTRIPSTTPPPAAPADEPQTTRLSIAKNAVRNAVSNAAATARQATRPPAPPAPPASAPARPGGGRPPREEREIESWLGELRGTGTPPAPPAPTPQRPSAEPTRAMPTAPEGRERPRVAPPAPGNEPTTAIPTPRSRPPEPVRDPAAAQNPDAAGDSDKTQAIPTPSKQADDAEAATEKLNTREDEERQRRGGVSAQDLLRREGRL
ncbi:MMPL family transporter [Mycolicibacterium novocastrense]|uniref:MMPL family transporter n=1 Tax=Mycolicibacterium novocastrense TaxID=59813 RepID=A0AAW5SGU6_MYCNV|nr:MMPL family transporter [Mycolicibacterium novocastrense]MCV7022968.1 MMPL family transporter [Mycolicibacterium novocastrense]GAT10942.1 RND superfamily drug efflux protein [Mycolicibacterium novocastrense]